MQVNLKTVTAGTGNLTVGDLEPFLRNLPGDAIIKIYTYDNQRDGSGWSIEAGWTEER